MSKNTTRKDTVKRSKKMIVRTIKQSNRLQSNLNPIEIEVRADFKQIVIADSNPAIRLAKSKGISYTIAKGRNIVEIKGTNCNTIGTVKKSKKFVNIPVIKNNNLKFLELFLFLSLKINTKIR